MAQLGRLLDLILLYMYFFLQQVLTQSPVSLDEANAASFFAFWGFSLYLLPCVTSTSGLEGEWERSKQQIQTSVYFCIFQHLVTITLCAWECAMYLHMCHQVCFWFVSTLTVLLGLVRDICAAPGWQMPCHNAGMLIPRGPIRTRLICCGDVQN